MESNSLDTPPTSGPSTALSDVDWVKAAAGAGLLVLGGSTLALGALLRVAAVAGGGMLLYGVAKRAGWLQPQQTTSPSTAWHLPAVEPGEPRTAIADAFESAVADVKTP